MARMQNRQTPSQASLFDAPAPADASVAAPGAPAEPLPLPDFLATDAHVAGTSPLAPPPPRASVPLWARALGRLLKPWLTLDIDAGTQPTFDPARPICYVLEDYGLSNALILARACREAGLPPPLQPMPGVPLGRKRAYVALSRRHTNALGLLPGAEHKTHSGSLARLLQAHRDKPELDVQLVPVSIFVGQAPKRTSGWFSVLFSENWTLVGRFRRLLALLLNGRDTIVRFAAPIPVREVLAEDLPPERTVRKLSRLLRSHFHKIREAVIGPDLSTRRLLIDKVLAAELRHAMRTGEVFSVLCMDLDGFKDVNDGFGHAAGDEVLCEVARRMSQAVRLGDLLARLGGDEFAVVMRHGGQEDAAVLAQRIARAVQAPITLSTGDTVGVGVSIGMASYTDSVSSVSALLGQADQALYQAKRYNERRWKMFVGAPLR